jgi:hypothetical protein
MNFHIARTAATTGNTLRTLVLAQLAEQGIADRNDAHVCFGVGHPGPQPALNANCSQYNKLEQARILRRELGERALAVLTTNEARLPVGNGPSLLLARHVVHSRGTDIRMCIEPWQVEAAIAGGAGFFTSYVPSVREFRTWTYRNRHLGTYEKVLRRPQDFKRIGRNHANGFDFSGVENDAVPQALKDVSRDALRGLGLDFGAVDVIQKPDGGYVVLEVNSAPGVSDERRRVIQALSHRVARWIANGCPARQG